MSMEHFRHLTVRTNLRGLNITKMQAERIGFVEPEFYILTPTYANIDYAPKYLTEAVARSGMTLYWLGTRFKPSPGYSIWGVKTHPE